MSNHESKSDLPAESENDTQAKKLTANRFSGAGIESLPFSGTPARYRKLAILGSLAIHLYLFIGFYLIRNLLAGNPWPTNYVPIVAGCVSMILFAFFAYRWTMRLDARYGRGSGWILEPTQVKLPWQSQRK